MKKEEGKPCEFAPGRIPGPASSGRGGGLPPQTSYNTRAGGGRQTPPDLKTSYTKPAEPVSSLSYMRATKGQPRHCVYKKEGDENRIVDLNCRNAPPPCSLPNRTSRGRDGRTFGRIGAGSPVQ